MNRFKIDNRKKSSVPRIPVRCRISVSSRDGVISVVFMPQTGRTGVRIPVGIRDLSLLTKFRPHPGLTQSPFQWLAWALSRGKTGRAWR